MALQIPKSYTGQYGGKSYIGLPKQTADLLANPPQIKPVVKPINPIPQEKPVYDPNRPVITSDTILQQNYENLNPQGIYNPYANVLPEEELRAKAEQSLRSRMQPEIDAIGQYYLTVRQQAEKDAQARMGRTMAMEAAAGRITSPSSTSNISETEQANTQQLNAIEAEKQMKIANILGKISSQAVEEAKAKRLEEMGKIDKSIEIRKKLFEESKARLADLSGVGLKFSELKTKSPDLYNSLLKGGMSDLEIDAYLTGKNKSVKDWKTQTVGNKTYIIKMYDDGTMETSEFATDIQPSEELKIVDGVPYAQSTDDSGKLILRPVQGYEESPEKALERRLKEAQIAKTYSDIKQTDQVNGASGDTADTMNLTESILNSKDFDLAFGGQRINPLTYVPGSNAYEIRTKVDQLIATLSLDNRKKLKGSGAISDFESKTLEKASSGLNVNMSPSAARKALRTIKGVMSTASGNSAAVKIIDTKTGEYQTVEANREGIKKAINDGLIVEYQ